jgi:hypothetical protein
MKRTLSMFALGALACAAAPPSSASVLPAEIASVSDRPARFETWRTHGFVSYLKGGAHHINLTAPNLHLELSVAITAGKDGARVMLWWSPPVPPDGGWGS